MSVLFKHPEHLKFSYYNYMTCLNLIRVDLLAVDAYEIAIGDEHYPIGAGNTAAIRAQQQDSKTRRKDILSARADNAKSKSATLTV